MLQHSYTLSATGPESLISVVTDLVGDLHFNKLRHHTQTIITHVTIPKVLSLSHSFSLSYPKTKKK